MLGSDRYSRHLSLTGFSVEDQRTLETSSVIVAGAGGLGIPVLLYLVAAGVGRIRIYDADVVSESNLHRQVLFCESDIGSSKVEKIAQRLSELNSRVDIEIYEEMLSKENISSALCGVDVIVDGTDNPQTRLLLHSESLLAGIPYVYGAVYQYEGQASIFKPWGPCYSCLFPSLPIDVENCQTGGVLGPLVGVIGSLQAAICIQELIGQSLEGVLHIVDLRRGIRTVEMQKDRDCSLCGGKENLDISVIELNPEELLLQLERGKNVFLLDVREDAEVSQIAFKGSHHICLKELPNRWTEVKGQKNVVAYCYTGDRGFSAALWLQKKGIKNVCNLAGGIKGWKRVQGNKWCKQQ